MSFKLETGLQIMTNVIFVKISVINLFSMLLSIPELPLILSSCTYIRINKKYLLIFFSAWKERIVSFLLEKRISLYSPHTSWDSVNGGVNDWLASAFQVEQSKPLIPGTDPQVGAGR